MNKIFRSFTALLMLLLFLAAVFFSAQASGSGIPFSGSGTAEDPYLIQSPADLANLAAAVNNGGSGFTDGATTFLLTCDLDLKTVCYSGKNWTPIGRDSYRFKYILDGGNHIISNLFIEKSSGNDLGLFGVVGDGAYIKNLILDESSTVYGNTSSGCHIGGLIGYIKGTGTITLENIGTRAMVRGATYVGGLFGRAWCSNTSVGLNVIIRKCYVAGSIQGTTIAAIGVTDSGVALSCSDFFAQTGCTALTTNSGSNQIKPLPDEDMKKSAEEFHSGAVAYALGGKWGQTFGEDSYPDLTSPSVLFDSSRNVYYHPNRIYGVSPVLGTDLSLIIYAYLDSDHSGAFLRTTWQEESADLAKVSEGNDRYSFRFTRISPQCMTEPLNAELRMAGQADALDGLTDYKIVDYCSKMLKRSSSDREKQLLVDLVEYGTAAQHYTGYRTDQLANADAEYLAAKEAASAAPGTALPPVSVRTLTGSANANGTKLSTVGLRCDYNNRLYLKLRVAAADLDSVSVDIAIGESSPVSYGKSDLTAEGEGVYRLETEPLSVTDFGKTVTFTLKVGGETVQVLTYGVNVWCYTVGKEGSTYPEVSRALAAATYRYGKAAADYIKH